VKLSLVKMAAFDTYLAGLDGVLQDDIDVLMLAVYQMAVYQATQPAEEPAKEEAAAQSSTPPPNNFGGPAPGTPGGAMGPPAPPGLRG